MKLFCYSIYDAKAAAFINPIFLPREEMAIRVFQDSVNDPNHSFGRHPEDYTLYSFGTWDAYTGAFELNDKRVVITGVEAQLQQQIADIDDIPSILKEQVQ